MIGYSRIFIIGINDMKMKFIIIGGCAVFFLFFVLLLFVVIFFNDNESDNFDSSYYGGLNLSDEVLLHYDMVKMYCDEYGISDYVMYILAIMQVESGGVGDDVMQASESLGLPRNSLSVEESIKQGCYYFSQLLNNANSVGCDINTVVQSYNYGGDFINYVASNGCVYTFSLSQSYAESKANGVKVDYSHAIAVSQNSGWRYDYGNMFYVQLVLQYLFPNSLDNDVYQAVMSEAIKYYNWSYVFGGSNPNSSFDCSGLTQWCYAKAGITLPRTAQEQYDSTTHIPLGEAQAGDLVFFHSTYNSGTYITHVGIYCGDMRMYHAGDPIGYADLTDSYWQSHLVCAGRIN